LNNTNIFVRTIQTDAPLIPPRKNGNNVIPYKPIRLHARTLIPRARMLVSDQRNGSLLKLPNGKSLALVFSVRASYHFFQSFTSLPFLATNGFFF
jgi:hypothetical protein